MTVVHTPHRIVICASLSHPDLIDDAVAELSAPGVEVHVPEIGRFPHAETARAAWFALIEIADEVVAIPQPGGVVGDAVAEDVQHAMEFGVPVRWWSTMPM